MKKLFLLIMLVSSINTAQGQSLIDEEVQQVASNALSDELSRFPNGEVHLAGAAVMEVQSGSLVANITYKDINGILVSIDGSNEYIPGALARSVLYLSMMPEIDPNKTIIDTGNGRYVDATGYTIQDHNHARGGYGSISLLTCYANNSNVGIFKALESVIHYDLKEYAKRVNKTGVLFGARASGTGIWDTQNIFGSNPYTLLQQMAWVNAVCGGPFIVKEEMDDSTEPYDFIENQEGLPYLREAMRQAVTKGLASQLNSEYTDVAALTNANPADVGDKCSVAVAYFPYDQPQYVVGSYVLKTGLAPNIFPQTVGREIIDWLCLHKLNLDVIKKNNHNEYIIHVSEK